MLFARNNVSFQNISLNFLKEQEKKSCRYISKMLVIVVGSKEFLQAISQKKETFKFFKMWMLIPSFEMYERTWFWLKNIEIKPNDIVSRKR